MKRIANNVALQTVGYVIGGLANVCIYIRENGYRKQEIYKGQYKDFVYDGMKGYEYCKVTELDAEGNVLYIGIEE